MATAKKKVVQPVEPPVMGTSDERIEDVTFQNLIKRWTAQRQWEWVMAANVMYGHILEERDR